MSSAKENISFNIKFWLTYFLYEWLANASVGEEYYRYFVNAIVIVPLTFIASVVTVHILFRNYYLKGQTVFFWITLVISVVAFVVIRRSFNYYYTYPLYFQEGNSLMPFLFFPKLLIEAVNTYLIVALYSIFYFIRAWYDQQREIQALAQQKVEAELQLLRLQVHPHFIFNTLNNIYSYAVRKNDETPNLIHRLSSFLSYNLYDSRLTCIELNKEMEYIHSYVDLEKIRYGDRLDVSINQFNSLDGFLITPLLLLPLVENCFKHGVTSSLSQSWIRIDLSIQNNWLTVKIENSVGDKIKKVNGDKNGLGVENVRKRLEIIYAGIHEFKYLDEGHSYMTILKLKSLTHEHKMHYCR
jgi:two-component system LytT family sensor kinase